jgi:hypothetical protein
MQVPQLEPHTSEGGPYGCSRIRAVDSQNGTMTRSAEPRRPLVMFATAVFIANVLVGAVLFLLAVSALTVRDALVSLAFTAVLAILQLWIARGLLRGERRAWVIGLAFAVRMLLPVGAGNGLPLLMASMRLPALLLSGSL